jgi:hypothetical protein
MTEDSKRGGARPGAGRKPEGDEPMVPLTIKVLPAQRDKLRRLGGAPWMRKKIDQAKEPK